MFACQKSHLRVGGHAGEAATKRRKVYNIGTERAAVWADFSMEE